MRFPSSISSANDGDHSTLQRLVDDTCEGLYSIFHENESRGNQRTWRDLEELLMYGVALPFLVASAMSVALTRNSTWTLWTTYGGDPNMHFWTVLVVLIPCLVASLWPQISVSDDVWKHKAERYETNEWKERVALLGSIAGDAAVMALALFLVPVAKHSPLIHVFGLSFTQALVFHKVAGWISLIFTILHGGFFLVDYGTAIFRGGRCWKMDAFLFDSTDWNWGTSSSSATLRHDEFPLELLHSHKGSASHHGCNTYFFNFTGLVSMVAFIILGLCSLPVVRRRAYSIFYTVHIPMAWIMLMGAIAHITYVALFLVPNIIYYFAPTVHVWIQQFVSARSIGKKKRGVQVDSVTEIADSHGCCLVRVRAEEPLLPSSMGAVCKLCVPQISSIWHPFSALQDTAKGRLLFLIRPTGPFTKEFLGALTKSSMTQNVTRSSTEDYHEAEDSVTRPLMSDAEFAASRTADFKSETCPVVLVDGVYPAEYRWLSKSLQHDYVLLVAGGVGIVPFISLSPNFVNVYKKMSSKAALMVLF